MAENEDESGRPWSPEDDATPGELQREILGYFREAKKDLEEKREMGRAAKEAIIHHAPGTVVHDPRAPRVAEAVKAELAALQTRMSAQIALRVPEPDFEATSALIKKAWDETRTALPGAPTQVLDMAFQALFHAARNEWMASKEAELQQGVPESEAPWPAGAPAGAVGAPPKLDGPDPVGPGEEV